MSDEEIDDIIWKIMMHNPEYEESSRISAMNGLLNEGYFDSLTNEEQINLFTRLKIGIQVFNAEMKAKAEGNDWRRLPKIEVSGNDRT